MISAASIQKTLHSYYSTADLSQGLLLYINKKVEALEVDEEIMYVWAEITETKRKSFEVEFYYDYDEDIWEGECECSRMDTCKHQVAALHELNDYIHRSRRTSSRRGRVAKVRRLAASMTENKRSLDGNQTGEYRRLPMKDMRLLETLHSYGPGNFQKLGWHESFEGHFISESELALKNTSPYVGYGFREQRIVLKKEAAELYVKCLSCNVKSTHLCGHQMALLTKAQPMLESAKGFLEDPKQFYQNIIKDAVKSTGVEAAAFHKYFTIVFNDKGVRLDAIAENMVGPDWMDMTQGYMDVQQKLRKGIISQQTKRLEEGRKKKYAFFWGLDIDRQSRHVLLLHFVKGEGLKTKEGIQASSRKVEELPIGFPKSKRALGRQLFFACREEDASARFQQVKTLIEDNRELLNSFYQYAYNGDIVYTNPKASELYLFTFHPGVLACQFSVFKKDGLVHLQRQITLDGEPFDYSKVRYSNEVFCTTATTAYCHPNPFLSDFMLLFDQHDTLIMPYTNKQEYTQLINGLKQHFEVSVSPGLTMKDEILKDPVYQILLREVGRFILFEPRLKYGDYSFNAFEENSFHIDKKVFRADDSDRGFLVNFLKNAHPDFDNKIQVQDYVFLDVNKMLSNYWFIHFIEACELAGIEVLGQKDLTKFNYSKHRAITFSHVRSGIDWFEVDMGVSFGEEQVKTADWIKALRNKESFVKLKDGSLGMLPEEWLKQAQKILAVADMEKGALKISKYRFNIIEDLFENIDDKEMVAALKAKKQRLAQIDLDKKYKLPKIVKADLRTYQKHGFEWLKFLDESKFGGILADDMGLGKTVQVISLLADQIKAEPSLVVVPRSLLFNWAAELDKFCPKLKYIIHHGSGRAKGMDELLPCHVIITTYGTAASDIEIFKEFNFNYIILDESQAIKNPDSKRYKAMRLLKSNNKIAMTGTPIENNTFDLYAQLSFTSPGLLGTKTSFKNNFAIPIDNYGDVEAANLLRKLIHPFLLRRTKEQVAKDLPEKTESIIYCEMGSTQRKLYTNLKRKIKEDIEAAVEEKGVAKSKFQMLDGLLRLRQMCNSPLLVNAAFSGANADSVKIDILLEHLTTELGDHSALIFSQFVSLLTILRAELDKRGIPYAYLDGSTRKRQKEVDHFMNDEGIKIFLISLKAGNTGLNLTKADYVYILDPWWNPAVEAQAIDRTHRIGQDKQVFAYKLICKDSIEEKILKLQERKKSLAKDIIRTDENVLKSLNKKELMALFD